MTDDRTPAGAAMYQLFSWEHSYFSGKVRAYLRFKQSGGDLGPGWQDILATPDLLGGLLLHKTGTTALPQLRLPDGSWLQDSSEIIDALETRHTSLPVVPPATSAPLQRLCHYLIELFADEWLISPAFWSRWHSSRTGAEPSHRAFNALQWGAFIAAGSDGASRRTMGEHFLANIVGDEDGSTNPFGPYAGLLALGCNEDTARAWWQVMTDTLGMLEAHLARHDYLFGGRPGLGDFALLGPLYAHIYRDAVTGFELRTRFPLVAEWVERTNGESALNARKWGQSLYSADADGNLVARPATSDGGDWLVDDEVPDTVLPLIDLFFSAMWPCLKQNADAVRTFIETKPAPSGTELPGKSFSVSPGFEQDQSGDGRLTYGFHLNGASGRRMATGYQQWMLQRLDTVIQSIQRDEQARASLDAFLGRFPHGGELSDLSRWLDDARVEKQGGRILAA